jgi:hypothetical protein
MGLFLKLFLILISIFSLYSTNVSEIPFSHPLSQSNDKLSPDNVNEFFNELESLPHITGSFSPMTGPYAWWQNLFPPKNNDGDFIYVHFKCKNKSWDDKWVANVSKDIVKNMREELLSFSPEL